MQYPRWPQYLLLGLFLAWLAHRPLAELVVDWLWFHQLGHEDVFLTRLGWQAGLWLVGVAAATLFVGGNLVLARRRAPLDAGRLASLLVDLELSPERLQRIVRRVGFAGVALVALVTGGAAAMTWDEVLLWQHGGEFGHTDAVFGKDVGYFVFGLPVLEALRQVGTGVLVATVIVTGAWYVLRDVVVASPVAAPRELDPDVVLLPGRGLPSRAPAGLLGPGLLSSEARSHLLVLGGLLFLALAGVAWLERFDLMYRSTGFVSGVGYADATWRLPLLLLLVGLSVITGLGLLASAPGKGWRAPVVLVGAWLSVRLLLVGAIPALAQDFYVAPNELRLEEPFIRNSVEATRLAFALDRVEVQPFGADGTLTREVLERNPLTMENVRIWDDRPLLATYGQIQEIRLYYDFLDVDVDRYLIDGVLRQVMVSAREFRYENLPETAQGWVNRHVLYTHGYGLTLSPVNVVTEEGMPELLIKDIPPAAHPDLRVDRPEIYYGEVEAHPVFVSGAEREFSYPAGDENVYTSYVKEGGKGGVPVGSLGRRLLFAVYFQSLDILLSDYVQADSRVLIRRQIRDRARTLAPFLTLDHDPYLVVADGRLVWMIDAYTVSHRYPYSEPVTLTGVGRVNYMRNAAKVVVDAFDGTVRFYVADSTDPIVQAWAAVFPGLFQPLEELPPSLLPHLRYPADFFRVQAEMYRAFHMTDPTVFYNKEDMWAVPTERYGDRDETMEPYYLIMRLPGEEKAEFVLLLPFVPTNKDNMISWLAARSDPPHYGKLILYQFPKQKLVFGPRQVEARIDQNPRISEQITLWSQAGSEVVRGNLLVIPIEDALLYVEPVYLQAERSQLPELKRVIVSYEGRIAMEPTLELALASVFGPAAPEQASFGQGSWGTESPGTESPGTESPGTESPGTGSPGTGSPGTESPGTGSAETGSAGTGQPADGVEGGEPWRTLASQAARALEQAQALQQRGDWAGYGEALGRLERALRALEAEAVPARAGEPVEP